MFSIKYICAYVPLFLLTTLHKMANLNKVQSSHFIVIVGSNNKDGLGESEKESNSHTNSIKEDKK